MPFDNPIVEAGVAGLCELYADRAVTPVEVCESYLSRIDGLDGALGAYVAVDAKGARAAAHASAERWAGGAARSLIDGVPIAVKANIAVQGLPWHAGVRAYAGRIAEADAACVSRLREAGAVILGLVNMFEGAFGGMSDNPWFGRTHNPWRHGYNAGGSSSGSAAAVAAGLCAGALGTDTLGSVRIPSSYCGIFGHKPTQGLIPTDGVVAMSWTLDHVGVHGRSAQDCARLLAGACGAEAELAAEIAEPESLADLRSAQIAALTVEGAPPMVPAVRRAFSAVIAKARDNGLTVKPLRLDYEFRDIYGKAVLIAAAESSVEHQAALAADPDGFSPTLQSRIGLAKSASAADLARAYRDLSNAADAVRAQLSPYAAILMPTTSDGARAIDTNEPMGSGIFTTFANVLGLPATAFPVGLSRQNLPISAQAVAWDDATSLGLAKLLASDIGPPPSFLG